MFIPALLVLAGVAWMLSRPQPEVAADNGIAPTQFVADLMGHQRLCSVFLGSTRDVDAVRVTIGTFGVGPQPLTLTVDGHSAPVRRYGNGVADLTLPAATPRGGSAVCIENEGTHRLTFAGYAAGTTTVGGKERSVTVSYQLVDHDPPAWSHRAFEVVRRVGRTIGTPLGSLTGWIVVVLAVSALAVAMSTLRRLVP